MQPVTPTSTSRDDVAQVCPLSRWHTSVQTTVFVARSRQAPEAAFGHQCDPQATPKCSATAHDQVDFSVRLKWQHRSGSNSVCSQCCCVLSVPNNLHDRHPHRNAHLQTRHHHHHHHHNQQSCHFESSSSSSQIPSHVRSIERKTTNSSVDSVKRHCPSKVRMWHPLIAWQSVVCVSLVVLCAISASVSEAAFACPPVNLIHRLQLPNGASLNRLNPAAPVNQTPECDCTVNPEGGWDILCYASTKENPLVSEDGSDPTKSNRWSESGGGANSKDLDSLDYNLDYQVLSTAFSINYAMGSKVTITCDHGAPVFKPALFQGFGVESVDTFIISNCELPMTLPLSVILYRTTPTPMFSISSKFGDSSYTINTTGTTDKDAVAPIRALYLTTPKAVPVQQLNTLLSDLESLEQLTLNDFNLNDLDHYVVVQSSAAGHKRVAKRAAPDNNVTNTTTEISPVTDAPEVEVITVSSESSARKQNLEATTISAKTVVTTMNSETETEDTTPVLPEFKLDTESIADSDNNTEVVTVASVATVVTMNSDIARIEPNTNTSESNATQPTESIDELIVENKPTVMLNENALNFGRILPNLRILRLRHFVNETTIPNVMFQILKGLNKLEYLELDSNILDQIPSNALSFAGANLKKLYMYRNSIREISERAFTNMTRLEILDLSQNKLTQLANHTLRPATKLIYLSLRNNQLGSLSEHTFQSNTRLVTLDLSQNTKLESLPGILLTGLTNLANFSLAYCNMTQVSDDLLQLFRSVPALTKLELRGNQLTNLTLNGLFAWNAKLSVLDASVNQLSDISGGIFSSVNSSHLTELNLNRNRLTELADNLFAATRNLRKLSVAFNQLRHTTPMTFIHLKALEELNLSRNRITTLNTQVNPLSFGLGPVLKKVDLSYNNLTDFDAEIYSIAWQMYSMISELNLKANQFEGTLTVPIFSSTIEPVIDLDLSSNRFTGVDVAHLLLDFNVNVDTMTDSSESGKHSETQVRLDNNPLDCCCRLYPFVMYTKTTGRLFSKESRSLSRKTVFILDPLSDQLTCAKPESLVGKPLHSVKLSELVCHIDDRRVCPTECECVYRSEDQAVIVDCDSRGLTTVPTPLQLSNFYNISVIETNQTIREVDNIILQLRNNSIQSIETLSSMFVWNPETTVGHKKPSFMEVWLDQNNITTINQSLIPRESNSNTMPTLRTLSLQQNQITYVPLTFLNSFERHCYPATIALNETKGHPLIATLPIKPNNKSSVESRLYLSRNPIDCYNEPRPLTAECYIRDLKTWLSTHTDRVADVEEIKCDTLWAPVSTTLNTTVVDSAMLLNLTDTVLCPVLPPPVDSRPVIALSIICVVLASSLFVVSVLYYRNKQTILAFIYIHLNPIFICLSFTENDLDEDKIYDAFVSYSSSDRDIVMELIEKLEKPQDMTEASLMMQNGSSIHEGKLDQIVPENEFKSKSSKELDAVESATDGQVRYRLCIHERDWLPGNLISWNIVNSVQNSKRTILVLSQSFIKSIWFQVEFHTAYYQMLEDKMDRLIVIVRGELPPKEEMDKDLAFLLTTKTYLVWGEKWFWEKLYYGMPHKKKHNVSQFTKQVKQCEKSKSKPTKLTNGTGGPTTNGMMLNGHKNGASGMLRWTSKEAQAGAMKDYVDKTIASHFQLDQLSTSPSPITHQPESRPAPKSLRNSGTLATANPATLQAFANGNGPRSSPRSGAYDNKSFINETNT